MYYALDADSLGLRYQRRVMVIRQAAYGTSISANGADTRRVASHTPGGGQVLP